jgi:NADH-quinone oxidoreductase subunit L
MYAAPSPMPGRLAEQLRPLYLASYRKFHVDELYEVLVVAPTRLLSRLSAIIDEYLIDGVLVRGTAWLPRFVGRDILAPLQNGLVQLYAATTALGVAILLIVLLLI